MSLLGDCLFLARHDLRLFLRGSQPAKPASAAKKKRWWPGRKADRAADTPAAKAPASTGPASNGIWLWLTLGVLAAPIAFFVALGLSKIPRELPDIAHLGISVGVIGLFLLTLLGALTTIADVLFLRRDGELLAVAPIDPRAPAIVRMVTVGISAGLLLILLTLAIAIFLPFVGGWRWFSLVPQVIAMALLAATLAIWLARVLFALFGAKRVRSTVYALASLLGLAFFVLVQSNNLIDGPDNDTGWLLAIAREWTESVGRDDPILWISKLMTGPVWMWGGAVLAIFLLYGLTAATSGHVLMQSALNPRPAGRRRADTKRIRDFPAGPIAAVMRKEWRIISRDSQIALLMIQQTVYLSPILIAFAASFGNTPTGIATIGGAAVVLAASSMSGRTVWLIAGGESAPELLKLAPAPAAAIRWGKILAITRMAAVFSVLAACATLALGVGVGQALALVAFGVVASLGAARIAFRFVRPISIKGFQRPPKGSLGGSLAQGLFTSLLGTAAGLFIGGFPLVALVPLIAAIAALYVFTTEDDIPRPAPA